MSIPEDKLEELKDGLQAGFDEKSPPAVKVSGSLEFNEDTGKPDGAEIDVEVDFK